MRARTRWALGLLAAAVLLGAAGPVQANYNQWLSDFRREALTSGISSTTLDAALGQSAPLERVVELDRRQPEGTITLARYLERVLGGDRISRGRRMLREHRPLLNEIGARYGVPAEIIVALWGIETSYGRITGGFHVPTALATLAYDGRRAEFFRSELLDALRIIEAGAIPAAEMTGSWAGAMGQSQFMPSTYRQRAVDYDGNGRADIWASLPDVFASVGNYLRQAGWQTGYIWGRPVRLPADLPRDLVGLDTEQQIAAWQARGVRRQDGGALPAVAIDASIIQPDGPGTQAYMVYENFRVLLRWNRSSYFATSVGTLMDALRG